MIIGQHKIAHNGVVELGRGCAVGAVDEVHLAIPRIERAMITRLPAHVEDDIVRDNRAAAHAVVKVDPRAGAIVGHVSVDDVAKTLALEVKRVLLRPQADLVHEVVQHACAARLVAGGGVEAHAGHGRAVGVPPLRNGRLADANELGALHGGVARVAGEEDGVAVERGEQAAVDERAHGALEEERGGAAHGPVAAARRPKKRIDVRGEGAEEEGGSERSKVRVPRRSAPVGNNLTRAARGSLAPCRGSRGRGSPRRARAPPGCQSR